MLSFPATDCGRVNMTEQRFKNLPFRVFILFVGIVVQTFGIAMITSAGIGTTPISSIPFVCAEVSGLTFGTTTFLFNLVFVAMQRVFLGKHFSILNLLQIPSVLVFSLFIDIAMKTVSYIPLENYTSQVVMSLVGNPCLAAGILLTIKSKTIVQPGEGFVLALAFFVKKPFPSVKIASDVSFVVSASLIGLIFLSTLFGVREGTIVSAFLVGLCVKWMRPLFRMEKV